MTVISIFQTYFNEVQLRYRRGDHTEMTYRTPFENFVHALDSHYKLQQEPQRKREFGAPDFKALYNAPKIGYIETKDIDKSLDVILNSDQMKRYMNSISNIVLTNYWRFILIRNGVIIKNMDITLFREVDLNNAHYQVSSATAQKIEDFFTNFFHFSPQKIKKSKDLAIELALRAILLKNLAREQLEDDKAAALNNQSTTSIHEFYLSLNTLLKSLTSEDCADAYAQTLTYGLFLARLNHTGATPFSLSNAASEIPESIMLIRKVFANIAIDLPKDMLWIVDDLVDILNNIDLPKILTEFSNITGKKDPFMYFYEDFLTAYDPVKRIKLGVYYTPSPIVSFITNSIKHVLVNEFQILDGYADESVKVLDPFTGTGSFLYNVFLDVIDQLNSTGRAGQIPVKIRDHLLKNVYGMEILITPFIISHLKLSIQLKSNNYAIQNNERIQIFLTNTFQPALIEGFTPVVQQIKEESKLSEKLKTKTPILAIIGNPPYSRDSDMNKGIDWINDLMEDYKDRNEKNIQPISDDYIRSFRFVNFKMDQVENGVLGFITPHSFLNGPLHIEMRKKLMETFSEIYILNLHGNWRRGEGDQNVFNIRQGVCISIMIKKAGVNTCTVKYSDLVGKRKDKYTFLSANDISTISWQPIPSNISPHLFVPIDYSDRSQYDQFISFDDIFENKITGIATEHDNLSVGFNEDELKEQINTFIAPTISDADMERLKLTRKSAEHLQKAKKVVLGTNWEDRIEDYYYRPFDKRKICYLYPIVSRGRWGTRIGPQIMPQMLKENWGIAVTKYINDAKFCHVLVTKGLIDKGYLSTTVSTSAYLAPLYMYDERFDGDKQLDLTMRPIRSQFTSKALNFRETFIDYFNSLYSGTILVPEEVMGYIYAVLNSESYQDKFNQYFSLNFPRIPFPDNFTTFKSIADLGIKLIKLHLMETSLPIISNFSIVGTNNVEKLSPVERYHNNKIYINSNQYFGGVSTNIWNFKIGKYQVLKHWLLKRKGRSLSSGEIDHFHQIIAIIEKTIQLKNQIDMVVSTLI